MLAGRYRLEEHLHSGPSTTMWRAADVALDRSVGVRFVTGDSAPDTLDAARRASLVEDPRLLRVLDAGTDRLDDAGPDAEELTYVVSEFVEGDSLATRLGRGTLPADTARTVVGEVAQALAHAGEAGLHHLRLTPASVVITHDGSVKVVGLGVDATLSTGVVDPDDGRAAAREDAVALVALLYAGLTGHWPHGPADGLPGSPSRGDQPVPPADLVDGVPNDLDTLCAVTLGPHEDGPRSPAELVEQLAPWRRPPVSDRAANRFPVRLAGTVGTVGAAAAAVASAAGLRPEPGAPARGDAPATALLFGDGGRGEHPDDHPDDDHPDADHRTGAAGGLGAAGAAAGHHATRHDDDLFLGGGAPGGPSGPGGDGRDGRDGDDPDPARRRQSTIALVALAALVVIGLAFAVSSLSTFGGGDRERVPLPPAAQPTEDTPEPSAEPTEEQTEEPTEEPSAEPPQIQGVRTLDPQGDGQENDDQATRAIDEDPGSTWNSETYNSAALGGLKDGIGFVLDLGRDSAVAGVDLVTRGSGGAVEVRTAPGPGLDGSEVVATADLTGDQVAIDLPEGTETQFVVLWFTELPDTGDGFRVELASATVR